MLSGQKTVLFGGWSYVSIFHIFISKQLQFKQVHWLRVWSPLPVYLSLLYDHFVGLLSHDATMEPDLSPVDDCNTQTPLSFPTSPDEQRRAPEQTLQMSAAVVVVVVVGLTAVFVYSQKREYLCSERMGAWGSGCPGHSFADSVSEREQKTKKR